MRINVISSSIMLLILSDLAILASHKLVFVGFQYYHQFNNLIMIELAIFICIYIYAYVYIFMYICVQ